MIVQINELMKLGSWLIDEDGDGLPDGLDVSIIITESLGTPVYLAIAQLAARLGLEVAALNLPLCHVDSEPEDRVCSGWRVIVGDRNRYRPTELMLPELTPNQARALLIERDLLVEGAEVQVALLLNYLAARLPEALPAAGADAVVLDGKEVVWSRCSLEVARSSLQSAKAERLPDEQKLTCLSTLYTVDGLFADNDGDFLPDDWRSLAMPNGQSLQEWAAIINLAARWGLETLGLSLGSEPVTSLVTVSPQQDYPGIRLEDGHVVVSGNAWQRSCAWRYLAEEYPRARLGLTWAELALYMEGLVRETTVDAEWKEICLEWEVTEVKRQWEGLLGRAVGKICAEVRVSEPLMVRQRLTAELNRMAQDVGVQADVIVRCAYKQGLHWIREEVIPVLRKCGEVERIAIEVAPFQVADALDPEARWLLELYPVDHVLADALGIEPEQITFALNRELQHTYRLTAWTEDRVLLASELDVWYAAQPYLPQLGEQPTVHPPTGGIKLTGSDTGFVRILTDAERVFAAYQAEILPELLSVAKSSGELDASSQPFFERLEVEVTCSEPEEALGVREEMVSVADALHEDIYFVGLDLFKRVGEEMGQVLRAPGLILPNIRVSEGNKPRIKYRLMTKRADQSICRPRLTAIALIDTLINGSQWDWQFSSERKAMKVGRLLQAADHADGLTVRAALGYPNGVITVVTRLYPSPLAASSRQGSQDDVIYLDECKDRLNRLKERPGMQVSLAGVSRQGRHIYSVAATSSPVGRIVSTTKFAGWKPTWLLNNRHHANEVSSTSAALQLMHSLTEGAGLATLLKRINVVCIPMENVDGTAIHQQLADVNPRHKLHAARFNSQGREFADSYFRDDPTVPEARALPDLWRRWVPDVVVDNHGIPSHEWEQPFSGYLCPWFASFWIPRSLFYAYFWLAEGDGQEGRLAAAGLEQAVTARLVLDQEIAGRNQELLASWRKYFVPYLEDHYAGEERGGIMWYYVPYQTPQSRFASHRWPNLTVLDWTTEVADETARADYLQMCSRAHLNAQEACLHWLAEQPVQLIQTIELNERGFYRKRQRQRPLTLKGANN